MKGKVGKLVNLLVFSLSGCFCHGQFLDVYCENCSENLILLSVLLGYVHISASSFSFGEHNRQPRRTSLVENDSIIPCVPGSSVLFQGNCISCTRPYSLSGLQYDHQSTKVAPSSKNATTEKFIGEHVFGCLSTSQDESGTAKINKGRQFLRGKTLRIVTIERHPFVKITNGKFSGVVFELLDAMSQRYNFTYTVFFPYDGNWGSLSNGSWNGMIGQVYRNEADVGAGGFSITLDRAKAIDFSMSFHQEPTGILIPAPQAGNKLTVLIRPLSAEVWLAVFTTICVLVPSLFVMHVVSLRLRRRVNDDNATHKPVKVSRLIVDLIQFIIGSLVQEGMVSPVDKTTRFLVVMWWFLTLVLANIYVGYMVSFLSAPKLFDLVDNLEGLLHQRELQWTYRKNTALEDLFQSNSSGLYKAIGMGAAESDLVATDKAGVEKVLSGHFAFLKEKSFLDVAIENDFDEARQCRVTMARETFFTVGLALVVQRGCTFLELLDREILHVVNTGLMAKWKSKHWPQHLWCLNAAQYIVSTQAKARKLTLDDCQGAYFILLCGLSLASTAFIVENRNRRFHKTLTRPFDDGDEYALNGYKIIVIPVKEDIYHKIQNLNLFKTTRKGVIDKICIR